MSSDDLVFRTVFVDLDVDQHILVEAKRTGESAGSVYRRYIEIGLAQLESGAPLLARLVDCPSVMRTTHVQITADEVLTALSCRLNTEKGELARRVARQGMLAT
jgi:hypothetical protein